MARISISKAKKVFEGWRREQRHSRSAVPMRLRRIALAIKLAHGIRIAQEELGISSSTLWQWGRGDSDEGGVGPAKATKRRADKGSLGSPRCGVNRRSGFDFVELKPASVMWSAAEVTFERRDGARMRVSGVQEFSRIEALAGQFLSGEVSS